jgi:hypothetical protein
VSALTLCPRPAFSQSCTNPSFGGRIDYGVGNGPRELVVADFDRDGDLDIVTADRAANTVSVILGDGAGAFSAPTAFAAGNTPGGIVAGDFNRDGRLDVVVANDAPPTVSTLLGDGLGSFAAPIVSAAVQANPYGLATADFNEDGILDVIATSSAGNVTLLTGVGNGSFGVASVGMGGAASNAVATGDFDNDGHADVAVLSTSTSAVRVRLGNGAGGFAGINTWAFSVNPRWLVVEDFDEDGRLDLAATSDGTAKVVGVRLGIGGGSFGLRTDYTVNPLGGGAHGLAAGDFDRDGDLDFLVSQRGAGLVSVMLGDGAGAFGTPTNLATSSATPVGVAAADFNRDGRLDLAAVNDTTPGSVSVFLNTFGFACGNMSFGSVPRAFPTGIIGGVGATSGDFNADGLRDLAVANPASNDISIFLGDGVGGFVFAGLYAIGTDPVAIVTADFDGDGDLDLATANDAGGSVTVLSGDGAGGFPTHSGRSSRRTTTSSQRSTLPCGRAGRSSTCRRA